MKSHSKKIIKPEKMCSTTVFFAKAKHQYNSSNIEFGLCDDAPPAGNPADIDESDKTK